MVTVELPKILSDIVGSILASSGDIDMLAQAPSRDELLDLTRSYRPDVVILGVDSESADLPWDLFASDPQLKVLGIAGQGRQTFLYELQPQRTPLGELSPDELVAAIRRSAQARVAPQHATGVGR